MDSVSGSPRPNSPPLVALVVLNWNLPDVTAECLRDVRELEYPRVLTVVVDNGSTDDSVSRLTRGFPECVFLRNPENLGFAEGNNVGVRHALDVGADYVMLVNNDVKIDGKTLDHLVEAAESDKCLGILGPRIFLWDPPEAVWYAGGRVDWRTGNATHSEQVPEGTDLAFDTDFVTGCGMMIRRDVLETVGLLDARFFIYYEDIDLCYRARRAGWRTVLVPRALMWHKVSAATGSVRSWYYSTRNRYLFGCKHLQGVRRLSFARGYATASVRQYRYLSKHARHEEAAALLDGFWSALLGRYGGRRHPSPSWLGHLLTGTASESAARLAQLFRARN